MKRLFLLILVVLLAACGGGGGGPANPPAGTIPPPQPGLLHSLAFRVQSVVDNGSISIPIYISKDRYNLQHPSNRAWVRIISSGSVLTFSIETDQRLNSGAGLKFFSNASSSLAGFRPEDCYRVSSPSAEQTAEANFISLLDWPAFGDAALDFIRAPQSQIGGRWHLCNLEVRAPRTGDPDQQVILLIQQI